MILMPSAASSFPVIPVTSHEGDHLQRMARLQRWSRAILRVLRAPISKAIVTSAPVTSGRRSLSSQVSYTCPLRRFTGARGTPRPPRISGQTGTSTASGCSRIKRLMYALINNFRPCQRQDSPSRQRETRAYIGLSSHHRLPAVKGKLAFSGAFSCGQ